MSPFIFQFCQTQKPKDRLYHTVHKSRAKAFGCFILPYFLCTALGMLVAGSAIVKSLGLENLLHKWAWMTQTYIAQWLFIQARNERILPKYFCGLWKISCSTSAFGDLKVAVECLKHLILHKFGLDPLHLDFFFYLEVRTIDKYILIIKYCLSLICPGTLIVRLLHVWNGSIAYKGISGFNKVLSPPWAGKH